MKTLILILTGLALARGATAQIVETPTTGTVTPVVEYKGTYIGPSTLYYCPRLDFGNGVGCQSNGGSANCAGSHFVDRTYGYGPFSCIQNPPDYNYSVWLRHGSNTLRLLASGNVFNVVHGPPCPDQGNVTWTGVVDFGTVYDETCPPQ